MIVKPRSESKELLKFRYLNARMTLTIKEKKHYSYLEKGYQGEVAFDQLIGTLQKDFYIINDLGLEYNNNYFQIDSLIMAESILMPFEVKNYEGNYYYESGRFYYLFTKEEAKNPLEQIKRTQSLFEPLIKKKGIYLPVEGLFTFINPKFTLYQAPLHAPIFYPTQLEQLLEKLNQIPSKLNYQHKQLADRLLSMHSSENPYAWKPVYTYKQVRRGVICPRDQFFMRSVDDRKLVCDRCGLEESVDAAVLRSVKELVFLFPEMKITTNLVHEWCGVIGSKKKIRRILLKHFNVVGDKNYRYYLID